MLEEARMLGKGWREAETCRSGERRDSAHLLIRRQTNGYLTPIRTAMALCSLGH
jgi:hypothetical protein